MNRPLYTPYRTPSGKRVDLREYIPTATTQGGSWWWKLVALAKSKGRALR